VRPHDLDAWLGSPLNAAKITHSSGITKAAASRSKIKLANSRPDSRGRPRGLMRVTAGAAVLAGAVDCRHRTGSDVRRTQR
jgi:hypothetical protein